MRLAHLGTSVCSELHGPAEEQQNSLLNCLAKQRAAEPIVSTLNATTGAVTANAAIVPVGSNGQVSVYTTDPADLIIDVSGYYAPPGAGGLALYNVTPCRAWDSRGSNGTNRRSMGCHTTTRPVVIVPATFLQLHRV